MTEPVTAPSTWVPSPFPCPTPRGDAAYRVGSQSRSAAVVLESGELLGQARQRRVGDHLADAANALRGGGDVEHRDALDAFAGRRSRTNCPSTWIAAQIASTGAPRSAALCKPG